jgi:uncharacterized membrane protein
MISQLQSDPMMLNQTHNPAATLGPLYFGLFAMIALLAIVFVIQVAFTGMALKALDRKPVELSELTSRTGEAGRWILLYLLMTVKIFLWSLLFVIPGIVAAMNYSQAIYLMLADPELKPADAIKQSIALIRGNRMRYFILQLSFILWNMLVSFTFGLAILYVGPYIELTNAAFFRELWALKNPAPPVAEVPANVIA